MKPIFSSILLIVRSLALGAVLVCALQGCVNRESEPSLEAKNRSREASTVADKQRPLATYTGRIELISNGVVIGRPGQPIPLCFVEMTLDPPGKDGRRKVELEARGGPQIHVVLSDWHVGDKISFEADAEELFKSDHPVRMANLKNIRVMERSPMAKSRPSAAPKLESTTKADDGSQGPWAPPPGFGPSSDKGKPAEATH